VTRSAAGSNDFRKRTQEQHRRIKIQARGVEMTDQQRAPFSEVPLGREDRKGPDLERADAIKGFTVEGGEAGAIPTTTYPQKRAFELGIVPVDYEVNNTLEP
jgi:hypothetical protein